MFSGTATRGGGGLPLAFRLWVRIAGVGWDVGLGGEVGDREEDRNTAPLYNFHFASMMTEKRDLVYYTWVGTKKLGENISKRRGKLLG